MSDHKRDDPGVSQTALVIAAAAVVVAVLVAVVLVAVLVEDPEASSSLIAQVVGVLVTAVGFFGLFVRTQGIKGDLTDVKRDGADVKRDVTELANGLGDAKTRTAIATVVDDRYLDPEARDLLARDRARLTKRALAYDAAAALIEGRAELDDDV